MNEFEKWDKEFRNQNMNSFNNDSDGLLWLKVRAICRAKQIKKFLADNNIRLESTKVKQQNEELFSILRQRDDAMSMLDTFLRCMNNEWYTAMGVDIEKLKEDLYKIKYYSWGGDQNNYLDRYFVRNYVKVISNYSELEKKYLEIGENAWNYVQNSWYNNWTSFIIESLFKRNSEVISAVGEIKSVDFFIKDCPLDLKVTFFPNQYMDGKLKVLLGKNPLSWLKGKCKEVGICCDANLSVSNQMYTLSEKLRDIDRTDIIEELEIKRRKIIDESRKNPIELARWLYENQGEMRFGAENRLYLILVDSKDYTQSWKMKRAFTLLEPPINKYIEAFSFNSLKKVDFEFNKKQFTAFADILFIVK